MAKAATMGLGGRCYVEGNGRQRWPRAMQWKRVQVQVQVRAMDGYGYGRDMSRMSGDGRRGWGCLLQMVRASLT